MNLFHQLFDEILLENALWQSNQTDSDSEFEKHLHQMYEFEYKLNAIKEWSFNGMPQRFANIRNGLTTELLKQSSNGFIDIGKHFILNTNNCIH